jgi:hypothetical protein
VAALTKLRDSTRFVEAIRNLDVVPPELGRPVAVNVIVWESAVAVGMLTGLPSLASGFFVAAVLLGVFSGVLAIALRRGARAACRCFGHSDSAISYYDVGRNAILFVIAAVSGTVCLFTADSTVPPIREMCLLSVIAIAGLIVVFHLEDIVRTLGAPLPAADV